MRPKGLYTTPPTDQATGLWTSVDVRSPNISSEIKVILYGLSKPFTAVTASNRAFHAASIWLPSAGSKVEVMIGPSLEAQGPGVEDQQSWLYSQMQRNEGAECWTEVFTDSFRWVRMKAGAEQICRSGPRSMLRSYTASTAVHLGG